MKKFLQYVVLCSTGIFFGMHANVEEASVTLKNQSGEDFIVLGQFKNSPEYLRNGAIQIIQYLQDTQKPGPQLLFVRPNDLILYASSSNLVERELKKTKPDFSQLGNILQTHLKTHVYYTLEGAGGLRRGLYTATSGDIITLNKNDVADLQGPTGFPSQLRLKKING